MNNDYNLLRIFKILYEERHLSRSAEKLGLSQPAISHALNRLRAEWGDPLFVKVPKGMEPTPLAHSLAPKIRHIIANLEGLYSQGKTKSLADYSAVLRIGATDYLEGVLLSKVVGITSLEAPRCSLVSLNLRGRFPKEELASGEIDLAMAGYFRELPEGYYQQTLFEDHFVCLVSENNRNIRGKLTLAQYLAGAHILTTLTGDLQGIVDKALGPKHQRKIVGAFSGFFSPVMMLNQGDYILTCLSKIADQMESLFKLRRLPPPIDLPKVKISQVWHERTHQDHLRSWLRGQIKSLC